MPLSDPYDPDPKLSCAGRVRICALLDHAEARFRNLNSRALARVLGTTAHPDDPVYEFVCGNLATERGVTIPRHGTFGLLAGGRIDDLTLVFAALVAAVALDELLADPTYVLPVDGPTLRAQVNRVLEEEALPYRLEGRQIIPAAGEPPQMAPKLSLLRAEQQLADDFADSQGRHGSSGLLFFDIDRFKALNTRLTETVVDEVVLSPLQSYIITFVSGRGFAYSVGGDEFIILLHNVELDEARVFAERLCQRARTWSFRAPDGEAFAITISVGYAVAPDHGVEVGAVRRAANAAEAAAKRSGRDRAMGPL